MLEAAVGVPLNSASKHREDTSRTLSVACSSSFYVHSAVAVLFLQLHFLLPRPPPSVISFYRTTLTLL